MSVKTWFDEQDAKLRQRGEEVARTEAAERVSAEELSRCPFDPRTEVSADAKAIMQRLTLLLFWLPLAFGVVAGLMFLASH